MSADDLDVGDEQLRALVRQVLLESIPGELAAARAAGSPPTRDDDTREVRVGSQAELTDLVRAIATECADPARREGLLAGTVGYRLAPGGPSWELCAPGTTIGEPAQVVRIERGAVTERQVREAASSGARIVAARGVVVTPLARDRARTSGVDIEKEH